MSTTRLELQNEIYQILNKETSAYGLITPEKVQAMIKDSLDHIAVKMLKTNNGWLTKIAYADVTADDPFVDLPVDCAIINFIKFKPPTGQAYVPISFNENADGITSVDPGTVQSYAPVYRFSDSSLHLEPTPTDTIEDGIMYDYIAYPPVLSTDATEIAGDIGNTVFIQYAKWRAAGQLYALGADGLPSFQGYIDEWFQNATEVIARRFRQPTAIRSFLNY